MPISGIVIRVHDARAVNALRASMTQLQGVELGAQRDGALAASVDALDYPTHDALLDAIRAHPSVYAVDLVFHDFSDVSNFPQLPKRQRASR